MKTSKVMKLLMAAMMMGMLSFPSDMSGKVIKVTSSTSTNNDDNREDQYPHRVPPRNFSKEASAHFDHAEGQLDIFFYADAPIAEIEIYKDGSLVTFKTRSVCVGDEETFDLSSYGSGDYEIIIIGVGDEDLYGTFQY